MSSRHRYHHGLRGEVPHSAFVLAPVLTPVFMRLQRDDASQLCCSPCVLCFHLQCGSRTSQLCAAYVVKAVQRLLKAARDRHPRAHSKSNGHDKRQLLSCLCYCMLSDLEALQ
jgi:hypothetical protein